MGVKVEDRGEEWKSWHVGLEVWDSCIPPDGKLEWWRRIPEPPWLTSWWRNPPRTVEEELSVEDPRGTMTPVPFWLSLWRRRNSQLGTLEGRRPLYPLAEPLEKEELSAGDPRGIMAHVPPGWAPGGGGAQPGGPWKLGTGFDGSSSFMACCGSLTQLNGLTVPPYLMGTMQTSPRKQTHE